MTIHLHRHIGQFVLSLTLLTVLAVVTGAWLDLGSQFYFGGFALIPFLLSALVIYNSMLLPRLPLAWGYWLAPVSMLMSWSYMLLIFRLLTGQHQPDALDSLVWFTLPIGHGLLILSAVSLHLLSKPLIDKYLRRSNYQR